MDKMERAYLKEAGAEEHKESLRTMSFEKLEKMVKNPEELVKMIEEREKQANDFVGEKFETDTIEGEAEISILERLGATHPGYDFYIARKQKEGELFKPETVLIAKRHGKIYLAEYEGEDKTEYEAIEEERFLPEEERKMVDVFCFGKEAGYRSNRKFALSVVDLASGGEATISPALFRRPEKFMPEMGVARKYHVESRHEGERGMICALKKMIKDAKGKEGAEYLIEPIDISETGTFVYEMGQIKDVKTEKEKIASNLSDANVELVPDQRLTVLLHMFHGIKFMHERGILHNDIKPQNIILTEERAKICDYGLMLFKKKEADARHRDKLKSLPEELSSFDYHGLRGAMFMGTLVYLRPKELHGRESKEKEGDLYAAAISAFEILNSKDASNCASPRGSSLFDMFTNLARREGHERFRQKLTEGVDNLSGSEDYQRYDKEKFNKLLKLLKNQLDVFDEKEQENNFLAKAIELLEDMGVKENLSTKVKEVIMGLKKA
ncbi:protein kinase [Patescibacteria group bacterium]|nr:protein kinase [Patescibacteria group bacterium]